MFVLLIVLISCRTATDKTTFHFKVNDVQMEQVFQVKLDTIHIYQTLKIIKNTLDDTATISTIPIPPGFTGRYFTTEFFEDSVTYKYSPHKATKGELEFEHIFYKTKHPSELGEY